MQSQSSDTPEGLPLATPTPAKAISPFKAFVVVALIGAAGYGYLYTTRPKPPHPRPHPNSPR